MGSVLSWRIDIIWQHSCNVGRLVACGCAAYMQPYLPRVRYGRWMSDI
ncbi:hypothetical protein HMPREF9081_1231 [Centipeda periodontii DSM 2778]|uniref:Uncharacterized protein n=1 Tax=Centipeda periodontii DSM 2778 TaxID=888060 RepID=F5RLS6_9FIRM|nr:hypothetical protein HMPREF9081_1231 [Centipeda periodontii DSM 2778]